MTRIVWFNLIKKKQTGELKWFFGLVCAIKDKGGGETRASRYELALNVCGLVHTCDKEKVNHCGFKAALSTFTQHLYILPLGCVLRA